MEIKNILLSVIKEARGANVEKAKAYAKAGIKYIDTTDMSDRSPVGTMRREIREEVIDESGLFELILMNISDWKGKRADEIKNKLMSYAIEKMEVVG